MKKSLCILCSTATALSLAACGAAQVSASEAAETTTVSTDELTTVTGKVTEIEGTSVTLALGEVSENSEESTAPEMPGGDAPTGAPGNGSGDMQTPPEKPEGDAPDGAPGDGQTPPDMQNGNAPQGNPPEKPDDNNGNAPQGNPPEKPDGDSSSDSAPEMPSGNAPDGATGNDENGMQAPPEMSSRISFTENGETLTVDISEAAITLNDQTLTADDIYVDDILELTVDSSNTAATVIILSSSSSAMGQPGGNGAPGGNGGFGGSSEVTQGDSANTITEDGTYTGTTYTSTGDDENALRVDGATVTLDSITVDKQSGATSNTENGDFYGMNAALLATNGATVTIKNATVTSSAQNGNGVFSYGSGTTVNISDSTITTTADNSGGIQTTGGGTTNASNLTVNTSGNSSAAIRSDRGGGTVNVDGGTYTSNGYNSPAVYSTAAITVKNATLTANNSEALVIEGQNSIALENCDVTGNMSDTKGSSSEENVHNVMIYQSMSGDAEVGTSVFSMKGGTLTSQNGDMFYITNTHCTMTLSGVTLKNLDSDSAFLRIVGNSASHGWGTAGSNGAQVEFTADSQTIDGDIVVDTISTLDFSLTNGSVLNGNINIVDNEEGGSAVSDNAVVTIDSGSTWNLTGNCTITSLTNNGTINFNGYTITLADGTVLK